MRGHDDPTLEHDGVARDHSAPARDHDDATRDHSDSTRGAGVVARDHDDAARGRRGAPGRRLTYEPISVARRWFAAHPRITDLLLAAVLTVGAPLLRLSGGTPLDTAATASVTALLLAQTVPLAWRRSHPWPVMAAVSLAHMAYELTDPMVGYRDGLYVAFAAYAVARYTRTPGSMAVIAVTSATVLASDLLRPLLGLPLPPELRLGPVEIVLVVMLSWALWLLGSSQRHIHDDAARLRDLTERLRAEREVSARRAVTAERARIARDLHDLVAHHVSAIAMQARATAEVMSDDPGLAGRGIAGIGTAADAALVEMRRLLGLLSDADDRDDDPGGGSVSRNPGTPRTSRVLRPEPSLSHLDGLADVARTAGCRVEVNAAPGPDVPPSVQVSAYRVVQEALTNVLRHAGPTDVRIDVRRTGERLTVVVDNGPRARSHLPVTGSGLGLIGMRERTALFGGALRAGPRDEGGWRVEATFLCERQA
ncbi:two-component sensor histidine kinase [Streptosporangium carneum]|uniref:histidine kinase n=2 Tax=Streptosporangium carneum TaxID=47481 RepID=A0A9W6MGF6_9ACTN|nr:two-component sensor histidine kinase [Streptosporangium carneum]